MRTVILRLLTILLDVVLLSGCFYLTACLPDGFLAGHMVPQVVFTGFSLRVILFTCVLWIVLAWHEHLFRIQLMDPWDTWFASLRALGKTALMLAIPLFLTKSQVEVGLLVLALLLAVLAMPVWRVLLQVWVFNQLARRKGSLLAGDLEGLRAFFEQKKWRRMAERMGVRGVLVTDANASELECPLTVLGGLDELDRMKSHHDVNQLLLCATNMKREELNEVLRRAAGRVEQMYILPDIAVLDIAEVELGRVGSQVVLNFNQGLRSPFNAFLKRTVDIVGSLAGLILLGPLLLLVGIAVRLDSKGPVVFRHRRFGRGKKHIHLNKFRTMVTNADEVLEELLEKDPVARKEWEELCKLKKDPRITRVGRFLRKVSIDELPQILNVLLGEMSLVGPRPISELEFDKYGVWQKNFMSVRPGLTGLWQVSGRSDLDFEDRVKLDMYYIRNWTIWLDLRIILKTLTVLVSNEGAY